MKLWPSIVFSSLIALIVLMTFYPLTQAASDPADYTLVIYGLLVIVAMVVIVIYVFKSTLSEVRPDSPSDVSAGR